MGERERASEREREYVRVIILFWPFIVMLLVCVRASERTRESERERETEREREEKRERESMYGLWGGYDE